MEINGQNSDDQTEDVSDDFITADTYCAMVSADMMDDYKNVIAPGLRYIEGGFMGKVDVLAKGFLYKLRKNTFFKESVAYPFVEFKGHKKGFFLSMEEYIGVLNHVDSNGFEFKKFL